MNPIQIARELLTKVFGTAQYNLGNPPPAASPSPSAVPNYNIISKSLVSGGGKATQSPTPSPKAAEVEQKIRNAYEGFRRQTPPPEVGKVITSSAQQYGVDPTLLTALLWQESNFRSGIRGASDYNDRGIAQINRIAHPEVSDEQAFDPGFAIPFAAKKLKGDIDYFGNPTQGLAAYNVGRGGAKQKGPKGQEYVDNVARNIESSYLRKLGITTSSNFEYD